MEAITNSLFHNNNLANLLAQTTQGGLNPQYSVNTRTKAKAELEITTAEGDRVTLFSQSKTGTAYASYDSQGKLTGAESTDTAEMYQIVSTNKVAIAVEGNLNEEELADIQRLLQSVEDIFMNFLSDDGTIEENLASSLSLDSMKSLSHFDAELKYSQKIEGFGVVSGSTGQLPGTTTSQESTASETGLIPETSADATPDLTTLTAFKARTKASLHISGTRLTMGEPAQTTSTEVLPEASTTGTTVTDPVMNSVSMINLEARLKTSIKVKVAQSLVSPAPAEPETPQKPAAPVQTPADGPSTPVSTDGTATGNQPTDTNSTDPVGTLSYFSTSRVKLVKEFAALVQGSAIDLNKAAPVFSKFIPRLISQLNDNYTINESQRGVIRQMGEEVLNTFQTVATE